MAFPIDYHSFNELWLTRCRHFKQKMLYSGDLNSIHLKSELLLVPYWNGSPIRCPVPWFWHLNSGLVFKWWSEYWSVNHMVIWIPTYHGTGHLNIKTLDKQANPHDLRTKLVRYSDPHCSFDECMCKIVSTQLA